MSCNEQPPVPPAVPTTPAPSNALGIWAVALSISGCCSPIGLILGIIGACTYPKGTPGRTMCLISIGINILLWISSYLLMPTDQEILKLSEEVTRQLIEQNPEGLNIPAEIQQQLTPQ